MWPLLKGLQKTLLRAEKTLLRAVCVLVLGGSTETFPFPGAL